jgi:hypothetical protein
VFKLLFLFIFSVGILLSEEAPQYVITSVEMEGVPATKTDNGFTFDQSKRVKIPAGSILKLPFYPSPSSQLVEDQKGNSYSILRSVLEESSTSVDELLDPSQVLKEFGQQTVCAEVSVEETEEEVVDPEIARIAENREWLHDTLNGVYGSNAGYGTFVGNTVSASCESFLNEICDIATYEEERDITLDELLFIKGIIQQESQHDGRALRWEDRNFRNGDWQSSVFENYKTMLRGKDPNIVFGEDEIVTRTRRTRPIHRNLLVETITITLTDTNNRQKLIDGETSLEISRTERVPRNDVERYSQTTQVMETVTAASDVNYKKFESSYGPMQILYATAAGDYEFSGEAEELLSPCQGIRYGLKHLINKISDAREAIRPPNGTARGFTWQQAAAAAYNSGSITVELDENRRRYLRSHVDGSGNRYYDNVTNRAEDFRTSCNYTFTNESNVCEGRITEEERVCKRAE